MSEEKDQLEGFMDRLQTITKQSFADWGVYKDLKCRGQHANLEELRKDLRSLINGEIIRVIQDTDTEPTTLRDLAQLLHEVIVSGRTTTESQ